MPLAYEGTMTKEATLDQLREHRRLDQIVQGSYWTGNGTGKGCAVGCLTHDPSGGHGQFPAKWGVPPQIAYLIDHIFESLPKDEAVDWPVRIMDAIPVGVDLSGIFDQWSVWMLRRLVPIAGSASVEVEAMLSLFERAVTGDEAPPDAWAARAAGAARAAARENWGRAAADELVRLVQAAS